jgi:hypothetical protein
MPYGTQSKKTNLTPCPTGLSRSVQRTNGDGPGWAVASRSMRDAPGAVFAAAVLQTTTAPQ